METPQPKRTKTLPTLVCVMAHDEGADFSSSDDSGDDDGAHADDLVVHDDPLVLVAEDLVGDWKLPLNPPRDVPQKNDVEAFLDGIHSPRLNKSRKSAIYQNLFTLFSFPALDAVTFGAPIVDNGRLYELVYAKFMMVYNSSIMESSYWYEPTLWK